MDEIPLEYCLDLRRKVDIDAPHYISPSGWSDDMSQRLVAWGRGVCTFWVCALSIIWTPLRDDWWWEEETMILLELCPCTIAEGRWTPNILVPRPGGARCNTLGFNVRYTRQKTINTGHIWKASIYVSYNASWA